MVRLFQPSTQTDRHYKQTHIYTYSLPLLPSKHILNAQVSIRSPCCCKWFDCADCHNEQESHRILQRFEMVFACKKCHKCFRKDASDFEEADEYCPHCDNHFVLPAKTPAAALSVESADVRVDNRMLKDDRIAGSSVGTTAAALEKKGTVFDPDEDADKLG